MTETKEKKPKKNVLLLLVFTIPIIALVTILFTAIICISPFAVIGYIFYSIFELINKIHKRKIVYKHNMQDLKYKNEL
jgi:amino acid permease